MESVKITPFVIYAQK